MNSINITGRLTADPELRTTQSGINCTTFTLAVRRPHTKDTTDFLRCVAWRATADFMAKYLRKGSLVAVTGVMTARDYTDKDGNKRTAYEVQADTVDALEKLEAAAAPATDEAAYTPIAPDDDLPF